MSFKSAEEMANFIAGIAESSEEIFDQDTYACLLEIADYLRKAAPPEGGQREAILLGQQACISYVEWYQRGKNYEAGALAHDLVTAIRNMMAALEPQSQPQNGSQS